VTHPGTLIGRVEISSVPPESSLVNQYFPVTYLIWITYPFYIILQHSLDICIISISYQKKTNIARIYYKKQYGTDINRSILATI
jgi:hypothetical protein